MFEFQEHVLALGLGLYLLILVFIFSFRSHYYRSLITEMKEPGANVMFIGALGLLVAIFLVLEHNVWVFESRVVVTILCWIFLLNAIMWLAAPVYMLTLLKKVASSEKGYYVAIGVIFFFPFQILTKLIYLYSS